VLDEVGLFVVDERSRSLLDPYNNGTSYTYENLSRRANLGFRKHNYNTDSDLQQLIQTVNMRELVSIKPACLNRSMDNPGIWKT
jgi:hypothetical protein